MRLSKEDSLLEKESNSIINQKKLIYDYALQHSTICPNKIVSYVDDGYSGTTFDRPAFQSMLADIRRKRILCIIVKDLSRLGRNYIEIGYYLEELFPMMGIRFIAINDYYDSGMHRGIHTDLNMQFKNMVNDFYCKDLSKKIRSTVKLKKENGEFTGGILPYGYRKEQDKIIIDQPAADIVVRIFQSYHSGKSAADIAKELNAEKIDSPSFYLEQYKIKIPSAKNVYKQWNGSSVLRILRNESYTGVLLYRKTERNEVTMDSIKKYDKNEWLRMEGKLPVIIPEEEFEIASSRIRTRSKNKNLPDYPKKYVGIIKCGYCNHNLTFRMGKKEQEIYYCRHYNFAKHNCAYIKISEQDIDKIIMDELKLQIALRIDCKEIIKKLKNSYLEQQKELNRKLRIIKGKQLKYKESVQPLYEDYVDGNIDGYTFLTEKKQLQNGKEMAVLDEIKIHENSAEIWKKYQSITKMGVPEFVTQNTIFLKIARSLVKEIVYYGSDSLEIKWNFKDEFL